MASQQCDLVKSEPLRVCSKCEVTSVGDWQKMIVQANKFSSLPTMLHVNVFPAALTQP